MLNLVNEITQSELKKLITPITTLCDTIVPLMLLVVGSLGAIWVIILCVKYAKADDPQEHEKAKKGLKNAVVGFVLIFVLLIMLKIGLDIFTDWYSGYDYN